MAKVFGTLLPLLLPLLLLLPLSSRGVFVFLSGLADDAQGVSASTSMMGTLGLQAAVAVSGWRVVGVEGGDAAAVAS